MYAFHPASSFVKKEYKKLISFRMKIDKRL